MDLEKFRPRPADEEKKRALDLKGPGPVIGSVGRLVDEKGQLFLIDALSELKNHWPDLRCVFVGEGPLENRLKHQAKRLGVESLCRFLGARFDVEELYPFFDIFVLPSLREPFGIALLEAMAAGLPVIATAAGGPLDYIKSGVNGILVPPADVRLLAEKIQCLLTDRVLAESLARAGQRTVVDGFDVCRTARKTDKIYFTTVKKRQQAQP